MICFTENQRNIGIKVQIVQSVMGINYLKNFNFICDKKYFFISVLLDVGKLKIFFLDDKNF